MTTPSHGIRNEIARGKYWWTIDLTWYFLGQQTQTKIGSEITKKEVLRLVWDVLRDNPPRSVSKPVRGIKIPISLNDRKRRERKELYEQRKKTVKRFVLGVMIKILQFWISQTVLIYQSLYNRLKTWQLGWNNNFEELFDEWQKIVMAISLPSTCTNERHILFYYPHLSSKMAWKLLQIKKDELNRVYMQFAKNSTKDWQRMWIINPVPPFSGDFTAPQ
jgi:hypothetical protein